MSCGRPLLAGVLAAVVLLTGACTGEHRRKDSPATTEQIPAGGGTVTSGQFTITMPGRRSDGRRRRAGAHRHIVIAVVAGGVTLILNDLFSLYRTVASKDHTQVATGRTTPAFTLTAGGVGPLAFGSSGSSAETTLKAAFGPPTRITDGPFCDLGGGDPGRQRLLSWGNLTVALHGEKLRGGGLTVRSWQVNAGRLTAPVKLPHGLVPGNSYCDLIGNAPGARGALDRRQRNRNARRRRRPILLRR